MQWVEVHVCTCVLVSGYGVFAGVYGDIVANCLRGAVKGHVWGKGTYRRCADVGPLGRTWGRKQGRRACEGPVRPHGAA